MSIKSTIVCGFPGVGKTTAEAKSRCVEDLESSGFQFLFDPETGPTDIRVPEWVPKYVDFIEQRAEVFAGCLLVSCHKEVREELRRRGIPFVVVVPEHAAKDEYMARYLKRGNSALFIAKIYDNWNRWLVEIDQEPEPVIHLGVNQNIIDVLPE